MQRKEHPVSPSTAISSKVASIPNLPQGACPAQEEGELGEEPAARREKEPPAVSAVELVPPPINLPRPRSGPHSPSGGMAFGSEAQARRGAARPYVCDFFSSRSRTGAQIHSAHPLRRTQRPFPFWLRLRRAKEYLRTGV